MKTFTLKFEPKDRAWLSWSALEVPVEVEICRVSFATYSEKVENIEDIAFYTVRDFSGGEALKFCLFDQHDLWETREQALEKMRKGAR